MVIGLSHTTGVDAQTGEANTVSIRVQIDANNRAVGRAIGDRDIAALEKLWAPEMFVNNPGNNILQKRTSSNQILIISLRIQA